MTSKTSKTGNKMSVMIRRLVVNLRVMILRLENRVTALEATVTKEMATAKALREVEQMAQMALNQLDMMSAQEAARANRPKRTTVQKVESLDVVTALIQIEDYLMSQLEKDGQMMSSVVAMRKAAKEIQEVVKMVQVMQAS